jgi:hypothetical protein
VDLIWFAFFRTWLRTQKPRAQLGYLREVSDLIGSPSVLPFTKPAEAAQISLAREPWAKMLQNLVGDVG